MLLPVRQFRAVDCNTRKPLAWSAEANKTVNGVLGGASGLVYDSGPVRGWGYEVNKVSWANLTLPAGGTAAGLGGSGNRNATCQQISGGSPPGLVGFFCIKCRDVFSDAITVNVREAQQLSGNPTGKAVPGTGLRVVVSRKQYNPTGGADEVFCDNKPELSDAYKKGTVANGYTQCVPAARRNAYMC